MIPLNIILIPSFVPDSFCPPRPRPLLISFTHILLILTYFAYLLLLLVCPPDGTWDLLVLFCWKFSGCGFTKLLFLPGCSIFMVLQTSFCLLFLVITQNNSEYQCLLSTHWHTYSSRLEAPLTGDLGRTNYNTLSYVTFALFTAAVNFSYCDWLFG